MNGWDLFTWLNCAALAGAAIVIFALFLKDAKGILTARRIGTRDAQAAERAAAETDRS